MTRHSFVAVTMAALAITSVTVAVYAQMSGQMPGHNHGAMQQSMTGAVSSDQMMRDIDAMMSSVTSTAKGLTSMPAGTFGPQHDPMMSSIDGLVTQMHQVHGAMAQMTKNPGMAGNSAATKSFQQAGAEFQKLGTSAQAMIKSLSQLARELPVGVR